MTRHMLGKKYKRRGYYNRKRKVQYERIRINSDGTVTLFFGSKSITHNYYQNIDLNKQLTIK